MRTIVTYCHGLQLTYGVRDATDAVNSEVGSASLRQQPALEPRRQGLRQQHVTNFNCSPA